MRLVPILAVSLSLCSTIVSAQPQRPNVKGFGPDLTGVDPALIVHPPPGIDYPGCYQDLVTADRDGNGIINHDEYLGFIQEYGKRKCYEADALTLGQHAAFSSLACLCRSQEGTDASCCLEENAEIPTAGALNTGRTEEEDFYLTTTCRVTDGTIDSSCPPYIKESGTPPPVMIVPIDPVAAKAVEPEDDNKKYGWLAAALLALLLLLCCVCCCVIRRKRAKAVQEEIEVVESTPGKGVDEEAPAEQAQPPSGAPRAMHIPPLAPTDHESEENNNNEAANRPGVGGAAKNDDDSYDGDGKPRPGDNEDDDESEGEGGRKRGSNYVPEEEDATRRKWPNGQLPISSNDLEKVQLRPIPNKEQADDPDWDQPGRDFDNLKVKDDDSVQEFERYVPDGGVPVDNRPVKDPVTYKRDWNRQKPAEEDENDNRKHRIQSGMGEGEVWDKLDNADDETQSHVPGAGGDVFDWVVSSAMDALQTTEEAGHLNDDTSVQVDNASVAPIVEHPAEPADMSFR